MIRRLVTSAILLLFATSAHAVIKKLTPLKEIIGDSQVIVMAEVEKTDAQKPSATIKLSTALKGKTDWATLTVSLKGDSFAKKDDHTKVMLDRLLPNQKLVFFFTKVEETYVAFGYLEGTWFQLRGTSDDQGKTYTWAFLHCEPFFRRTYKGTTEELKAVVEKAISGTAEPPAPNEKEEPGFGPVPEKKSGLVRSPMLYGVIPTTILIGPLALVAALFPAFFARMAVAMKQWRTLLTVASITTTLSTLYYFGRGYLPDHPLASPRAFLSCLTAITVIGLIWSGFRYRKLANGNPVSTHPPTGTTLGWLFGSLAVLGLFLAGIAWFVGRAQAILEVPTRELAVVGVGLAVAILYSLYRRLTRRTDAAETGNRLSFSGESAALFGMSLGSAALLLPTATPTLAPLEIHSGVDAGTNADIGPKLDDVRMFTFPGAFEVYSGITVGPGNRLLFGAESAGGTGSVWCVEPDEGKVVWKFTNGGNLQPVFCTPTVRGDRVYVGEGLHTDSDRRLFCLDAKTGQAVWNIKTESHTEGQANLVGTKLYFSAGDDGLLCVDTETRKELWRAASDEKNKLHVDTPPVVVGNRVFFGSGYNTLAALCVDATTGQELWRYPSELRSFGPPLARGGHVYFGLGTGNLMEDLSREREDPRIPREREAKGAIVCLDPKTGAKLWQYDLPRSVHTALAADRTTLYANCKNGTVYALDRATGELRWKRPVGTSFATGPVIANAPNSPFSVAVYSVSLEGRVVALNPRTGEPFWTRDLAEYSKKIVQAFSQPALVMSPDEAKRSLFLGGKIENRNNGERLAAVFRLDDAIPDE
jgi:outer membrane protein assembly factor BamB